MCSVPCIEISLAIMATIVFTSLSFVPINTDPNSCNKIKLHYLIHFSEVYMSMHFNESNPLL